MEVRPYFEKIEDVIIEDIKSSKQQLLIAVAWFTNHKIFNALIEKLDGNDGFTAKLIVINDNINHRPGGLDFQKFVSAGGCLYFAEKNIPMHNKYMVIDSNIVITGSYNYTYYAETLNDENIVRIDGNDSIVKSYADNFKSLVEKKPTVTNVKDYLSVNPPAVDLFSYNNYALKDMSLQSRFTSQAGVTLETKKTIQNVEAKKDSYGYENFVINNVIYEQWKDDYYIERIEVRGKRVKITFKTIITKDSQVWSPDTRNAWIICLSRCNGAFNKCYAIRDVCVNNEIVISEVEKGTVYEFYENEIPQKKKETEPVQYIKIKKDSILTCDVCFIVYNQEFIDGTIDFIEGKGYRDYPNHWNALKIQMSLNRERLA